MSKAWGSVLGAIGTPLPCSGDPQPAVVTNRSSAQGLRAGAGPSSTVVVRGSLGPQHRQWGLPGAQRRLRRLLRGGGPVLAPQACPPALCASSRAVMRPKARYRSSAAPQPPSPGIGDTFWRFRVHVTCAACCTTSPPGSGAGRCLSAKEQQNQGAAQPARSSAVPGTRTRIGFSLAAGL